MGLLDFWNQPKVCRPTVLLQQLEERIVLDAAITPTDQQNQDNTGTDPTDQTDQIGTAGPDGGAQGGAADAAQSASDLGNVFNQDLNVVLISNALGDIEGLCDAVVSGATVIVFDAQTDSLGTLTDKLDALVTLEGAKIDHLAILSHGGDGALVLDPVDDIHTIGTIHQDTACWEAWGSMLTGDARIDLYGCSIGGGETGLQFVQALASLTSATVWASGDDTGNGPTSDWELEIRSAPDVKPYLMDWNGFGQNAFVLGGNTLVYYSQAVEGNVLPYTFGDAHTGNSDFVSLYVEATADLDGYYWYYGSWGSSYLDPTDTEHLYLYNENGTLLQTFGNASSGDFSVTGYVSVSQTTWDQWTNPGSPGGSQVLFTIAFGSGDDNEGVDFDDSGWTSGYYHDPSTGSGDPNYVRIIASWNDRPYAQNGPFSLSVSEDSPNRSLNMDSYFHDQEDGDNLTYNTSAVQTALINSGLFDNVWWSGRTAFVIGISHLLPPAKEKGEVDSMP